MTIPDKKLIDSWQWFPINFTCVAIVVAMGEIYAAVLTNTTITMNSVPPIPHNLLRPHEY